jgi:hypothetical protein
MRTIMLQFGSVILAAVGAVLIAASLLSVSTVVLADEPLNNQNVCAVPKNCNDPGKPDTACAEGTCAAYGLDCNECCDCIINSITNLYECQSNGDCE